MNIVKSPCINVCEYNKDGVCRGCYRSKTEITNWINLTNEQKGEVLKNTLERKQSTGFSAIDYDYYV
jgi:uncharacterized protein